MKTILLLASLIMFNLFVEAQITITPFAPSPVSLRQKDIFNASITNIGLDVEVTIRSTLTSRNNSNLILEGRSKKLTLKQGTLLLSESVLQPIYSYYSSQFKETGLAPFGSYEICIYAMSMSNEVIGEGCTFADVSPTTPPLLIYPDDKSIIDERYPLLTWLTPTPVSAFGKVLFDIKLVELFPNQTPYDAIQRNNSILEKRNIKNTYLQYPANAIKLDTGKVYSWRILAKTNEGDIIGETEVWSFRIRNHFEEVNEIKITDNYIKLKREIKGESVYVKNTIRIVYNKEYSIDDISILIVGKNIKIEVPITNIRKFEGNRFEIDLSNLGLKTKDVYVLEAKQIKDKEAQVLKFVYIK